MEINGVLRNVRRVTSKSEDPRAPCLSGQIYGDTKGRFHDGEYVTTSMIMAEVGDIFTTRYSAYRVESWAPGHGPKTNVLTVANDNHSHASAINLFAADCHAASRRAGWYTDLNTGKALDRNVPEMLMLIVSEIAEGIEGFRKKLQDDKLPHRPMIEVELADAMIRIGDLASFLGLDLGGAVVEKMSFNATREDHKLESRKAAGGKAF